MMISEITAKAGAHKRRKRVGRGESSGHGKTCGRGNKGCQSRSGGGTRPLHEGGQMPLFRRLPKRGFSNVQFATEYQVVNLGRLESVFADGDTVDLAALRARRLVRGAEPLVKILGTGMLAKKLLVTAHAFSASAKAAIEKAGGAVTVIGGRDAAEKARAKRNTRVRARPVMGGPDRPITGAAPMGA
jgi:large subunit ribosomal protein L15